MAREDVKLISGKTVSEHNTRESCWIIVHGHVYDVTDFLDGENSSRLPKYEIVDDLSAVSDHPGAYPGADIFHRDRYIYLYQAVAR